MPFQFESTITSPSELRAFLETIGARPKKSLSQNFLVDRNILGKILSAARIAPGDYVLEIGAGPGALTEALLKAGAEVIAVEKDRLLARALTRFSHLEIFETDFLDFSFTHLKRQAKVVSNLPYHLTAPILERLIEQRQCFSSITVMVQHEVANRMVAEAQTADYGLLSLFLHFYTTPTYCFRVSKHCFYPQPKVDSAVVTLEMKSPPSVDAVSFFEMLRKAFQQRRKMLRKTLGAVYGPARVEGILDKINALPTARPEELSLNQFLSFFKLLA